MSQVLPPISGVKTVSLLIYISVLNCTPDSKSEFATLPSLSELSSSLREYSPWKIVCARFSYFFMIIFEVDG